MDLAVTRYCDANFSDWDDLVAESTSGTFLQTRKFLGYHGDRFHDDSVCVWSGGHLIGVLPAARDPQNPRRVTSHPGITYGGLLHRGKLRGQDMLNAFSRICDHYRAEGYSELRYKTVPIIYHRAPAQDDLYALFRFSGQRFRCDLSVAIDLSFRLEISSRRRRAIKKAEKASVIVSDDATHVGALWEVLTFNLSQKHEARPVHTVDEIRLLHSYFPQSIRFLTGLLDGEVVAGVVLFMTPTAVHAQYIGSNDKGYETNALDLIFQHGIEMAKARGARYFNFGICNEDGGKHLNDGLFRFKMEFGGAGIVHEFYDVALG